MSYILRFVAFSLPFVLWYWFDPVNIGFALGKVIHGEASLLDWVSIGVPLVVCIWLATRLRSD